MHHQASIHRKGRLAPALLLAALCALAALLAAPAAALAADSVPVYRLYNQWSGEHLFTRDATERSRLLPLGWSDEGEGWDAPATSSTPVYRLFNPYTTEHLYTAQESERDGLGALGWRYEDIAWYSDDAHGVPVYRLYNHWERTYEVRAHHYTADRAEYERLGDGGWTGEDVVWYGVAGGSDPGAPGTGGGTDGVEPTLPGVDTDGVGFAPGVVKEGLEDVTAYEATEGPSGDITVTVPEGAQASEAREGGVVIFPPTESYPTGLALKVSDVSRSGGGAVVTGVAPKLWEAFDSLDIVGSGRAEVGAFEPAEGVTLTGDPTGEPLPRSAGGEVGTRDTYEGRIDVDKGFPLEMKDVPLGKHTTVSGRVWVGIDHLTALADVDFLDDGKLVNVHRFELSVTERAEAWGKLEYKSSGEAYLTKDVEWDTARQELGSVPIHIPNTPLSFKVSVYCSFSAKGSAEIDYEITATQGLRYENGEMSVIKDFNRDLKKLEINGSLRMGAGLLGDLALFDDIDLAGYFGEVGPGINALYTAHTHNGDYLWCAEGSLYLYARHGVDPESGVGALLRRLGVTLEFEPLTDDDSNPLRLAFHLENGRRVDECSRLSSGTGRLYLVIRDDGGRDLAGAAYTLTPRRGGAPVSGTYDGPVDLTLPAGRYDLEVSKAHYRLEPGTASPLAVSVANDGPATMNVVMQPVPTGQVSVTVTDEGGQPLAGASYALYRGQDADWSQNWDHSHTPAVESGTIGGGSITLTLDADDEGGTWYTLEVSRAGYATRNTSIHANPGEASSVTVALSPGGTGGTGGETWDGRVKQVAQGYYHTLVLMSDGSVWAWGANDKGQLGDGTTTERHEPVRVDELENVVSIACGTENSAAITRDGSLWMWGANIRKDISDSNGSNEYKPRQIAGISDVTSADLGTMSFAAVDSKGDLYVWGDPFYAERDAHTPLLHNVKSVKLMASTAAALTNDGNIWMWGYNEDGYLFDTNSLVTLKEPVMKKGISDVVSFGLGAGHCAAITSNGDVWTWGNNSEGQLGDGNNGRDASRSEPKRIVGLSGMKSVALTTASTVAVANDGKAWSWGYAINGSLGRDFDWIDHRPDVPGIIAINDEVMTASGNACVTASGDLYTWGFNKYGQVGDGTTLNRDTPVPITVGANLLSAQTVGENGQGQSLDLAAQSATDGLVSTDFGASQQSAQVAVPTAPDLIGYQASPGLARGSLERAA